MPVTWPFRARQAASRVVPPVPHPDVEHTIPFADPGGDEEVSAQFEVVSVLVARAATGPGKALGPVPRLGLVGVRAYGVLAMNVRS